MARTIPDSPVIEVRRIVACSNCGGRRRSLVETAAGLRGLCIGCGVEVSSPLATERTPMLIGRAGQLLVA
jgi:hypothetical protein